MIASHLKIIGKYLKLVILFFAIVLPLSTLNGCGDPIPEKLDLTQDYQMFGIRVDPPVVRPDDTITVTAYDHHPSLKDLAYNWSVCLYSHGAGSNYECLRVDAETGKGSDALISLRGEVTPRVQIDLSESGIDLRTRIKLLQELDIHGERRELTEGIDIFVVLMSGDPREKLVRSVKRVRVIDTLGEEPLASNPVIKGWRIEEQGVANLREPCLMIPPGPLSALQLSNRGEIISGHERADIMSEVSGQPISLPDDPNTPECVMHSAAQLNVDVNVEGAFRDEWDTANSYTYRWYVTSGHQSIDPVTLGGEGLGSYQLLSNSHRAELIFTVRDPEGGFSIGRQKINLVPGISTR